jgi:uncharacterized protein DUF2797
MTQFRGNLRKMLTTAETPVAYRLPIGETELPLNALLGKTIRLEYAGEIACVACGQRTKKSFNQGYCYRCFTTLAQCDLCIVKPELCHFAKGTCREPEWALTHCMQPHYVYLANSSGLKVGITRQSQIPTRWLDQGATQALLWFQVPNRHQAGLLEVAIKRHVADRTDWRKLLKGEPELHDLKARRDELGERCGDLLSELPTAADTKSATHLPDEEALTFAYPVLEYPKKVSSFSLDKTALIEGTLLGIKGQYLILDTGVLNIRKFTGYHVTLETEI